MKKIILYFKETKAEMKNVTWPSRDQSIYFTVAVLLVSVFVAYYLGLFDWIFSQGLQRVITK